MFILRISYHLFVNYLPFSYRNTDIPFDHTSRINLQMLHGECSGFFGGFFFFFLNLFLFIILLIFYFVPLSFATLQETIILSSQKLIFLSLAFLQFPQETEFCFYQENSIIIRACQQHKFP